MTMLQSPHSWYADSFASLAKLHLEQRLPHALLLKGMPGIGKSHFAKCFAQYLLCQSPQPEGVCGRCKACELNAAGSHPDLFILEPEEAGKQLKVDQVRGLVDFIYSTAQQGGYRVVIINPADAMNTASANALLKMLEEPGKDTLLLLVTSKIGQILPTIKSRCQLLDCPVPSEAEAIAWLQAEVDIETQVAMDVLKINKGAPQQALAYINNNCREHRTEVIKGLADILKRRRSAVEVAQVWQKFDMEQVLGWLYGLLSDVARASACADAGVLRQQDARNMLAAVAKKIDPVRIFKLADKVQTERQGLMQRQNPNKQLLLESILLEWSTLLN